MHCDGKKSTMIVDRTGDFFGSPGTLIGEAEFGWTGVTRGSNSPYDMPVSGLSDDAIPSPMKVDSNNVAYSSFYSEVGVYRNSDCTYNSATELNLGSWFCPASTADYYDLSFESLDEDFLSRKLSPIAVRSSGYLYLLNGPADHSACTGYACTQREALYHTTVVCNKDFDYYLTSVFPLNSRFMLPYAPADCLIRLAVYNKRQNRVDLYIDGEIQPAKNAVQQSDGSMVWSKPDSSYIPQLGTDGLGANYHDKSAEIMYFMIGGGDHTFEIRTAQTLVLELGVVTELTEDDVYDNGDMALNLAAILGVDPSRIRVMDVISESSAKRRKRSLENGWKLVKANVRSRRSGSGSSKSLRIEILPEINSNYGTTELDEIAARIVTDPSVLADPITDAIKTQDASVSVEDEIAIASPPKDIKPPAPVSILEKFGVEEQQEDESIEEFNQRLESAMGAKLTDFETAESRNAQAQELAEAAESLTVYKLPSTLHLDVGPNSEAILDAHINRMKLYVTDSQGNLMETVGYKNKPFQVKAELVDHVQSGDGSGHPSINGKTVVEFEPGNGYAHFTDIVFSGDLVSARIKFSISYPQNTAIEPVITDVITFMKRIISHDDLSNLNTATCPLSEASFFNRQATFSDGQGLTKLLFTRILTR